MKCVNISIFIHTVCSWSRGFYCAAGVFSCQVKMASLVSLSDRWRSGGLLISNGAVDGVTSAVPPLPPPV